MPGTTTPPVTDQPTKDMPARQDEDDKNDFSDSWDELHLSYGDVQRMIDSAHVRYVESTLGRRIDEIIKARTTALLKDANHLAMKNIHKPVYSTVEKSVSQAVRLGAA